MVPVFWLIPSWGISTIELIAPFHMETVCRLNCVYGYELLNDYTRFICASESAGWKSSHSISIGRVYTQHGFTGFQFCYLFSRLAIVVRYVITDFF